MIVMMIVMMARVIGDTKHGGGLALSVPPRSARTRHRCELSSRLASGRGCQQETDPAQSPLGMCLITPTPPPTSKRSTSSSGLRSSAQIRNVNVKKTVNLWTKTKIRVSVWRSVSLRCYEHAGGRGEDLIGPHGFESLWCVIHKYVGKCFVISKRSCSLFMI